MARARNIKPAFFQNEDVADLSPIERLAFIGLWTIADFRGCLEYRPKRLKVQLFPYDDCSIEDIVANLNKSGLIRIYSVQGQRYIKVVNFEKHQNPHKNERDAGSDIPDIDENNSEIIDLDKFGTNTDKIGSARADSLLLIPDSLKHKQGGEIKNEDEVIHSTEPSLAASVCLAVKKFGIPDVNPANPSLLKLLDAGATVEEFASAAEHSKVKKFTYVIGVVNGQRNQAAEMKVTTGTVKPKEDLGWRNNDLAILKKAKELGIHTQGKNRFELLAKIDEKRGAI